MRWALAVCWLSSVAGCGGDFGVGGAGATTTTTASSTSAGVTSQGTGVASTSGSSTSSATTASASASASSSTGMIDCDADADGAEAEGPGCCVVPDACDCDDTDPEVFPGQVAFFDSPRESAPNPMLAWDYDCDGIGTKEYPFAQSPCGLVGLCNVPGTSFRGEMDRYECGAAGTITNCQMLTATCDASVGLLRCR